MASTVGVKGQIVIEKPIRDALGIQPGFVAVQDLKDDHLEIRFYPPEHRRSLRGALAGRVQRTVPARSWHEEREKAWARALGEGSGGEKPGG
jgi:AbrB family looped-hinge helix DNA binding protein